MSLNFYSTTKRSDAIRTYKGPDVPVASLGDQWFDTVAGETKQLVSLSPVTWATFGSGGGGVTDHGALTGLADDDHSQYYNQTRGDARYSQLGHTHTASEVTDFNTSVDARISSAVGVSVQAYDGDLNAIAALAGTSGLLRKTAANTWSLDTSTFLTANQTITLSGDISGSGATSISTTLATVNASPQTDTFRKVTVNGKGLVTATSAVVGTDINTAYGSQTANQFLAAPNGSAGNPGFRAIVAADIPTLNQNTTGTASNVTGIVGSANGGTGINNGARTLTINTNAGTIAFTNAATTLTVANTASVSGTNTGDQTITLTGNVTGTGTGSFATTISNNVVTNAMLSTVATATFKGRTTAGTGNVEDLTATQATALLNNFTTSLKGLVPGSGGGTTNFLRADGTWAAPPGGGGGLSDGDYGDITVSGTGTVLTIDAGAVSTSKLGGDITTAGKALLDDADAAAQRTTLGLATVASSGSAADLTGNLAVARLNSGTGASSSTYWRGDGTWAAVSGATAPTWWGNVYGAFGDCNPNTVYRMITTNGTVAATPTNVGTSVARIAYFRPPQTMTLNRIRWFGVGATTNIFRVAVYNGDTLARLTSELAFTTASNTWGSVATAGETLTAGQLYFIAVSVNATGTTAGPACINPTGAATTGQVASLPKSFPGNLDIDLGYMVEGFAQFTVTTGALPATAATIATQGAWTGGFPAFWLDNNSAA